jgi:hypothetical protein
MSLREALLSVQGKATVKGLKELPRAFKQEAEKNSKDSPFAKAQIAFAMMNYFEPVAEVVKRWGFRTPLATIVLAEAAVQHGAEFERSKENIANKEEVFGIGCIVNLVIEHAGSPEILGEEKWLEAFLRMRKSVLDHAGEMVPEEP